MNFVNFLQKLPFHYISNDLLTYVVENEFSDCDISYDFRLDNDCLSNIKNTNNALREYFAYPELSSITWRPLIEDNGVEVHKCLGFILCILNYAKKEKKTELVFELCSLYLLLINLPLSRLMNVFHQNLYLQCIEIACCYSTQRDIGRSLLKNKTSIVNYFQDWEMTLKNFDTKDTYSLDHTMRCLIKTVVALNATLQDLAVHIYDCAYRLFCFNKPEETLLSLIKYATPFLSMCEMKDLNANEQIMNLKQLIQFFKKLMENFGNSISDTFLQLVKSMTITSAEKPGLIEIRRKRIMVIVQFVKALSFNHFEDYMNWFTIFTSSTKKQHRVFAQQYILQLLPTEVSCSTSMADSYAYEANRITTTAQSHKKVLMIILNRCYDTSDEVVTKALQNLAEAFNIPHMSDLLTKIFDPEAAVFTSIDVAELPTADSINKLLLHYLREEKISLRKAALQVLECIANHKPKHWLNSSLKNQLVAMVRDFAISIRSQALSILTEYVSKYMIEEHALIYIWLENVLPEASNTVSELDSKIYLDLSKLFLENLVPFENIDIKTNYVIPWNILQHIQEKHWRPYLENSMKYWNSKKLLGSNVITMIQTYIHTKYNLYALLFLSCVAKTMALKDITFAVEYYEHYINLSKHDRELKHQMCALRFVLEILSSQHSMPSDRKDALSDSLILQITTWNVPVKLVVNFIDTITNLQNSADWKEHYVEIACDTIKEGLSALQDGVTFNINKFEISLLLYAENSTGIRKLPFRQLAIRLCHKICSIEQSVILLFRQKPTLYRTMLLTLGRLCLREEVAATNAIPIYIKIMFRSPKTNEKILCFIILKDLCTMYTRLVEPHLDVLLLCFRCENRVRAVAARLITELMADGYIKLNEEQMVCYFSMVLDEQKDVKCVVEYFISQKATASQDKDFLHDMLLSVIYFHNNKVSSLALGKAFSYNGDEMIITRHNLYRYMVFNMREQSRYKTVQALYNNILEPWSLSTDESSNGPDELAIVCDALTILSLRQMKPEFLIVGAKKNNTCEEEEMRMETDEEEPHVDDKKMLSLIEMMTPTLLKFKTKIRTGFDTPKGEILKQIFLNYIDELSIDFKKEIKKLNPEVGKPVFGK